MLFSESSLLKHKGEGKVVPCSNTLRVKSSAEFRKPSVTLVAC